MESISFAPKQSVETTIHTAGGAYISGNVVAETFIGRDQYNYYFIGLAPLVHDPTRRFRNFLNEYLGTSSQSVPFGGRQAQLEGLHSWLNDADAPPYYLMTAEAGRGKSALVCRWMEEVRQKRPEVEVIFIPISIRFETAAQDTVFAALAARLAKFYDEPLKPAALSGAQWQGVCESYLDRTPPVGKQLLIILDGLDEATGWHFGAGFFSTDPPPGLRVVVTARLRVGESTPQGWAATLGWPDRLTRMVTLPPLTRVGVEEALASMGDPLAGFADQVTIVEQLYRLTEGDPLLVRLYVQEFEKQKASVSTLNSAALQQMKPGLQGYFDQWWKGQKAQWRAQGSDPEKEEAQLRLLLDALAAALGPLTLDDLAQLHSELGSSRLIRAQLQSVERWVIGDGKTHGYSYSHARLGYYFWEQLSDKEQAAWDGRFCAWGATTLVMLKAEQLEPKAAPVYLLRHYSEHLERSHAPAETFYALLSNGWRLAWEGLDISYGGFLNDVDRAWERAKQAYAANKPGQAAALVQQIRATLCRSSVAALSSNIPSALLAQLVETGLCTSVQALAIVKQVLDKDKQAATLAQLAPHLPDTMLEEVLAAIHAIKDERYRARALGMLAPYLPKTLLPEVLSAAYVIKDGDSRVRVLGALAPHLPETLLQDAWRAAYASKDGDSRAEALSVLVPHLPECERTQALEETLAAVRKIWHTHSRAEALSKLMPHLPKRERTQALEEALAAACASKERDYRAKALDTLAPHLSETLLEKALATVRTIKDEGSRVAALVALAPHLSETLLQEAWCAIRATKDEDSRASALGMLVSHLPERERIQALEETFASVCAIKLASPRVQTLCVLAPYLTEHQRRYALDKVRTIKQVHFRAEALGTLARHLTEHQRTQALEGAWADARAIKDEDFRTHLLCMLAPHLPGALLEKALADARAIKDEDSRARMLCVLAPYLPRVLLEEAWDSVRAVKDHNSRTRALCKLAIHLSGELLESALATACALQYENYRADVLGALVPRLSGVLLEKASAAIHVIKHEYSRANALGLLARHLPERERIQTLREALASARAIKNEDFRAKSLGMLAPHLPRDLLAEALAVACVIKEGYARAYALGMLAPNLPEELVAEALATIQVIKDEASRARALCALAPRLSGKLLAEALTAVCAIEYESSRAHMLGKLAPYLPKELLAEAWRAVRAIKNAPDHAKLLGIFVQRLPECERIKELREVLQVASVNGHENSRAHVLSNLAPYLPGALLDKALYIASAIKGKSDRAHALNYLAPHLAAWASQQPQKSYRVFADTLPPLAACPRPGFINDLATLMPFILALAGDEAPQAAEGIYHAIQEVCAWWP